jgi:antitoxin ParD1/3/4
MFVKTLKQMKKSISIDLADHFQEFIEEKVNQGIFSSPNDVIEAGLRLLELDENKVKNLNIALEIGKSSPLIADFKPIKFLEYLNQKHA